MVGGIYRVMLSCNLTHAYCVGEMGVWETSVTELRKIRHGKLFHRNTAPSVDHMF